MISVHEVHLDLQRSAHAVSTAQQLGSPCRAVKCYNPYTGLCVVRCSKEQHRQASACHAVRSMSSVTCKHFCLGYSTAWQRVHAASLHTASFPLLLP